MSRVESEHPLEDEHIGIEYQYAAKRYAYSRAALRMAPILWRHAMLRGDETFLATTLRVFLFNHIANFGAMDTLRSQFRDAYQGLGLSDSATDVVIRLSASVNELSVAAYTFAEAEVVRVREEKGEAPLGRHTDWIDAGYDALARSDGDPRQMLIEAKKAFGLEPVSAGFEEFDRLLSAELREKFGEAPRGRPLWAEESPLADMWIEVRTWLQSQSPKWDFSISWYDDVLAGREPDREFLREVALIPDDVWAAGVDAVNAEIVCIHDKHGYQVAGVTVVSAERLMKAALAKFRFDELRRLMKMVPFAEDIQCLRDQDVLNRFLASADLLRLKLETLVSAFEAEGRAMQGAGSAATYLKAVLEELSRARQLQELQVGWVIECGEILQSYALCEEVRVEFGALHEPFKRGVDDILELTQRSSPRLLYALRP